MTQKQQEEQKDSTGLVGTSSALNVTSHRVLPACQDSASLSSRSSRNTAGLSHDGSHTTLSVHTNTVYDVLAAPSIGFEVSAGRDWSIGMDGWLAWVSNKEHDFWWQNYGIDLYGRYWFGDGHSAGYFKGWHAGLYAGTLTYDVWYDGSGYQSPDLFKTFRTGAELGWSGAIAKDWRADIYYGLGWFHTRQKVYDHNFGGGYYVSKTRIKNLLDYSRFGITISYIIK